MGSIKLNDILKLNELNNVKIRFNLKYGDNWDPIQVFQNKQMEILLEGQYWNYSRNKSFRKGQITIGFLRIKRNENFWLLYHIGRVTNDLNIFNGIGYEYETLTEYEKYFGRLIVRYKNTAQTMIRRAEEVIDLCEVAQILPDVYDNDLFPGYDKVNVSWQELCRVIEKDNWKTALQNQKGVYLITDTSNGRMYVGSAYGDEMILNRWRSYVKTVHGNNVELKGLELTHMQNYFRYSILDIFKSTTDSQVIIERESWWKHVLMTRRFGYNSN